MKLTPLSIFCAVLMLPVLCVAQQPVPDCDPLLPVPEQNPQRYEPREITCEGIYIQEVSATSIISLAVFTEKIDKKALTTSEDDPLKISWTAPDGDQEIKIRAQGIGRKIYYRMDSKTSTQLGGFDWNLGVLEASQISLTDIGLTAWIPNYSEDIERLFVPLELSQQGAISSEDKYTVAIMPSQELNEVSYTLTFDPDGDKPTEVIGETPLNYGYYPNDRPIVFSLEKSSLQNSGIYKLHLVAEPSRGASRPLDIWFYHAGTP